MKRLRGIDDDDRSVRQCGHRVHAARAGLQRHDPALAEIAVE